MIQRSKRKKKIDTVYNDHLIDDVGGLEVNNEIIYNRHLILEANQEKLSSINSQLIKTLLNALKNMNYVLEEIEREHPNVAQAKLIDAIGEIHNDCTGIINFTEQD